MTLTREKIAAIAETDREDLELLRAKVGDAVKDRTGNASNTLAGVLRFLAVADYVLNKNVTAFREQLSEAAQLRIKILERFDAGEAISPSYVSMMTYKSLLGALAASNEAVAKALASCMGGREAIEVEYDRPFDRAFGLCLKSILAKDVSAARSAMESFQQACNETGNADFKGYATALRCIVNGEAHLLQQAFDEILAGHRRQSVRSGLFKDSEDEVLCVWGVGIANLARWSGLPTPAHSDLLPADLVR